MDLSTAFSHAAASSTTNTIASAAAATSSSVNPVTFLRDAFDSYRQTLYEHPLSTKMITGATIAVVADAIAQAAAAVGNNKKSSSEVVAEEETSTGGLLPQDWYNSKRAVSFATFDAVYRAAQHYMYPPMVQMFQGQYITALLSSFMATAAVPFSSPDQLPMTFSWAGPMEQALASQLIIIPVVYYPVFFAVTGVVQGLTVEETIERAKTTFIPIMKRNLLYWIPCQFATFALLAGDALEPLQIPVLTGLGLIWTIILSLFAGSAGSSSTQQQEQESVLPEPEMAQVPLIPAYESVVVLPQDTSVIMGDFSSTSEVDSESLGATYAPAQEEMESPSNERLNLVLDELEEVEVNESSLASSLKNYTSSSY